MERSKQTADVEGPTNVDMGSTIFACDLSKVWASTTPCKETTEIQWARDECSVARSYMATDQRNSTSMSVQWSSYWKPTMSKGTEQVRPLCGREANDMNVNVARTRNAHTLRSREAAVMILTQLCGA